MTNEEYKRMYVEFHSRRANEKGLTPEALWGSSRSQRIRFEVLATMIDERENFSILDVGCGLADFYDYLRSRGCLNIRYVGLDYNELFIKEASARYPECAFFVCDLEEHARDERVSYDYVVASGIYNLGEDYKGTLLRIERDMRIAHRVAKKAYGVNFLSIFADTRDPQSLYYDPNEMLKLGQAIFGRYLRLHHDYLQHDFTLLLFKSARSQIVDVKK